MNFSFEWDMREMSVVNTFWTSLLQYGKCIYLWNILDESDSVILIWLIMSTYILMWIFVLELCSWVTIMVMWIIMLPFLKVSYFVKRKSSISTYSYAVYWERIKLLTDIYVIMTIIKSSSVEPFLISWPATVLSLF